MQMVPGFNSWISRRRGIPPRGRHPRRGSSANAIVIAIVLVLVAINIYQLVQSRDSGPRPITPRGDLAEDEQAQIALYLQTSPSVVHITSVSVGLDRNNLNPVAIPRGSGSGFIWDEAGHIVTNYHVVHGGQQYYVYLHDKSSHQAELVGAAPHKDLAVLKINAPKRLLQPILLGRSADLQVGQKVFAIGNPFGLDHTLTTGVISGLGREIDSVTDRKIRDVIQTDAAINPGNSGGPLLDSAGCLIGVNTAIVSPSGAYAGIGFAVPADEVTRIVPQLIQHGRVIRPGLGISYFTDQEMEKLIRLGVFSRKGVLVKDVIPDGGAAAAGVRPTRRNRRGDFVLGDLIVAIDGEPVESTDDMFRIVEGRRIGETVTLTVVRDGEERQLPLTLKELP